MDKKIRLGIIGLGNMGSGHARSIMEGKCPDFDLVAVADINPARVEWGKANLAGNIRYFDDALAMLDSGCIDACMVCVPHYDHPRYAMACMQRGIHVMVEKPAGVYTRRGVWHDVQPAHQPCVPQNAGAGAVRPVWPDPPYQLDYHRLVPSPGVL